MMSRRHGLGGGTLLTVAVLAACGGPAMPAARPIDSDAITLPTEPTFSIPVSGSDRSDEPVRTTRVEPPITTETTSPPLVAGRWTDITGNLLGLESDCGNVSAVAAHPALDQVVVGIALQGLWALAPEANGWLPLGTTPGSDTIRNRMVSVAFDPDDPQRFWQSGIYAEGLFETRDGGATFEQLGDIQHTDGVSVDFTDPERATLLAGGHERGALYLSTDGGITWDDIAANVPPSAGATGYPLVLDGQTFLLGTYFGESSGVFRSEDAGATWRQLFEGEIRGEPLVEGDTIAWLAAGGGLFVSTDGGRSFRPSESSTGRNTASVMRLTDGRLAALGERAIVVSADMGDTWTELGPELPYDPVGLAFSAARSTFYIWYSNCNAPDPTPVPERGVMQLEVDFGE